MKTLKKVLAVVLALAMVLGMTTFASAAFEGETITYKEAVDVLNGIGVITGKADGKFDPAGTLTRAEGATIITKLVGQSNFVGKPEFKDAANHWAASAIAYVTYAGIADGVGGNSFNPDGVLTGNAFAKWLAAALGYNVELEGMTGKTWEIGVANVIRETGLTDGIETFAASKAVTREEAAQLAFNALQTNQVKYTASINSNGVVTYTKQYGETSNSGEGSTLMAAYFSKLVSIDDQDVSINGQTSHTWYYKGTKIGSYGDIENAIVTYTGINGKAAAMKAQIKADLAPYPNLSSDLVVYKNNEDVTSSVGSLITANGRDAVIYGEIANGRSVSIYGSNKAITKVVIIDELVAQVTKVASKSVSFKVYAEGVLADTITLKAPVEDDTARYKAFYEAVHDLKKDDVFTFTYDATGSTDAAKCATFVGKCEKLAAGKLTNVDTKTYGAARFGADYSTSILTIGGEKYQFSNNCIATELEAGKQYTIWTNNNGYIVKATAADKTVAYVYDIDFDGTRANRTYYAYVLYTDGTDDELEITKDTFEYFDGSSTFGFYELNSTSKGYVMAAGDKVTTSTKLDKVAAKTTLKASYTKEVGTNSYLLSESAYIFAKNEDGTYTAYDYTSVPKMYLTADATTYCKDSKVVCIVVNEWLNADNEPTNVFVINANGKYEWVDDDKYVGYNALVDGVEDEIYVLDGKIDGTNNVVAKTMYAVKATDEETGYITYLDGTVKATLSNKGAGSEIKFSSDDAGIYSLSVSGIGVTDASYKLKVAAYFEDTTAEGFTLFGLEGTTVVTPDYSTEKNAPSGATMAFAVNASGAIEWAVIY